MAKELELKYGCNPNQKPARIFMQEGGVTYRSPERTPGIHQFYGCTERLAVGERIESGYRNAGCDFIQTC